MDFECGKISLSSMASEYRFELGQCVAVEPVKAEFVTCCCISEKRRELISADVTVLLECGHL